MARDTWLPTRGPGSSAFEQALRLRPELYEGYEALRTEIARESGLDAGLMARAAARVLWLLTAEGEPPAPADDRERAAFVFVDKFVRDPHAVVDSDVAALRMPAPQLIGFVESLALLDGFTRAGLILGGAES